MRLSFDQPGLDRKIDIVAHARNIIARDFFQKVRQLERSLRRLLLYGEHNFSNQVKVAFHRAAFRLEIKRGRLPGGQSALDEDGNRVGIPVPYAGRPTFCQGRPGCLERVDGRIRSCPMRAGFALPLGWFAVGAAATAAAGAPRATAAFPADYLPERRRLSSSRATPSASPSILETGIESSTLTEDLAASWKSVLKIPSSR
jgi:hypothetical protein